MTTRHSEAELDARPQYTAELSDLLLGRFKDEYLPAAIDPDVLAANHRTTEERLAAAKMIVSAAEPVPTAAGVLVLGREPQRHIADAYIQFLRVGGTQWGGDVVDEARCEGPVADQIRRLDDKLIAHNRVAVDFTSASLGSARQPIRWRRCSSSSATPSCTAPTKARRRRCASTGSTTASRS